MTIAAIRAKRSPVAGANALDGNTIGKARKSIMEL